MTYGIKVQAETIENHYDQITRSLKVIDYAHHEVHDGCAFWVYNSAVLANGDVSAISIQTPNSTKWSHLLLQIDATANGTFDVLEDVTSIAGGTPFTLFNFNRNSTTTSANTAKTGDTPGADAMTPTGGSEIWNETFGTRGVATSRKNASELILKQNSLYLFRVTNGTNANTVTILLTWYEHINKTESG